MDEVWFYSEKEMPHGIFSNFYSCEMCVGGLVYHNSESYFQAEKFRGENASTSCIEYAELIRKQNTPNKAAVLARQKKPSQPYPWAAELYKKIKGSIEQDVSLRLDWDSIKDNVMRRAVFQKFFQNKQLIKILKETGSSQIVEHTHRDDYWGDGHPKGKQNIKGEGKNMLGKILEETRYVFEGELSSRYSKMLIYPFSNWIIPGMFLASGGFNKETFSKFKTVGFRYFVSLMPYHQEQSLGEGFQYRDRDFVDDNFCIKEDNVITARYAIEDRSIVSDKDTIQIAMTIIRAMGLGFPTVLHCLGGKGRTGVIACIVVGLLYGINGDDAIHMCENLFLKNRPNKGKKILKNNLPQTQKQISQVKRILSRSIEDREYYNFY